MWYFFQTRDSGLILLASFASTSPSWKPSVSQACVSAMCTATRNSRASVRAEWTTQSAWLTAAQRGQQRWKSGEETVTVQGQVLSCAVAYAVHQAGSVFPSKR